MLDATKRDAVLSCFSNVKKKGKEYIADCPACGRKGHVYISFDGEGAGIFCQGCKLKGKEIAEAAGISASKMLYGYDPDPNLYTERTHIYYNADGTIFGKKLIKKYYSGAMTGKKKCNWLHYESGKYITGLGGRTAPLYNLPELLASTDTIYVVEGEKDVETLKRMGYVATSAPNGANQVKWPSEYNEPFKGRTVIVLTDNDDPGETYGRFIVSHIIDVAESVKVIPATAIYADALYKWDISDIVGKIGADKTKQALREAIEAAACEEKSDYPIETRETAYDPFEDTVTPATEWASIVAKSASQIDFSETPQPIKFVDGILTDGVYLLNGFSKVGKSRLLLQMLIAISSGETFLGMDTKKSDCLYLAFEDQKMDYENRLKLFIDMSGSAAPAGLYALTKEDFPDFRTPTIGDGLEELIDAHLQAHPETGVIGIDVFSIIQSKRESKDFTKDERRDLDVLLRMAARYRIAIVICHHTSKAGLQASKTRDTSTGSGAGSYAVSGTVIGEMELIREENDKGIFRANGRRTASVELSICSNYPKWELEGNAADIRERERIKDEEGRLQSIIAAAEYLIISSPEGKWTGNVSAMVRESENSATVPPFIREPAKKDMESQALAAALWKHGIRFRIIKHGTASQNYSFSKLNSFDSLHRETMTTFDIEDGLPDEELPF